MAYIPPRQPAPTFPEHDPISLTLTPDGTTSILNNFGCCLSGEQLIVIIAYLCGQLLSLGGTATQALAASHAPNTVDTRELLAYAAGIAHAAGADGGETGDELWQLAQHYGYNNLTQTELTRVILGGCAAYVVACEP